MAPPSPFFFVLLSLWFLVCFGIISGFIPSRVYLARQLFFHFNSLSVSFTCSGNRSLYTFITSFLFLFYPSLHDFWFLKFTNLQCLNYFALCLFVYVLELCLFIFLLFRSRFNLSVFKLQVSGIHQFTMFKLFLALCFVRLSSVALFFLILHSSLKAKFSQIAGC